MGRSTSPKTQGTQTKTGGKEQERWLVSQGFSWHWHRWKGTQTQETKGEKGTFEGQDRPPCLLADLASGLIVNWGSRSHSWPQGSRLLRQCRRTISTLCSIISYFPWTSIKRIVPLSPEVFATISEIVLRPSLVAITALCSHGLLLEWILARRHIQGKVVLSRREHF